MIYTITLNPAIDYYMGFKEKEVKHLMRTKEKELLPGGKGINASILLTNLGVDNKAIVLTGPPTGSILLDLLKQRNVDYVNFNTNSETRINTKIDVGDTFELNSSSANKNPNISNEIYDYLKQNIKEDDVVMIMGTTMQNLDENIVENISEIVVNNKAKVVYDLQGKEILNYLKFKPLVIKPNTFELGNYFNNEINSYEDIEKYSNKLIEQGAQNVIVSQDKDGAYLFNKEWIIKTNPLKINMVNGSGAGDSMISGFVYELMNTNNFEKAINFANASGAGTASVKSIADKEVIAKLEKQVTSEIRKGENA